MLMILLILIGGSTFGMARGRFRSSRYSYRLMSMGFDSMTAFMVVHHVRAHPNFVVPTVQQFSVLLHREASLDFRVTTALANRHRVIHPHRHAVIR